MDEESVAALLAEDHAEVDMVFRQLLQAFEEGNTGMVFSLLDFLWARLAVHIRAENLSLFPAILRMAVDDNSDENAPRPAQIRSAISELRLDHDFFMRELAGAVNRMRTRVLNPSDVSQPEQLAAIRQAVEAVRARLESHNRLEEEKVYGWPALLLDAEENGRLYDELKLQLENMPPRFNASLDTGRAS